jgi:hypothetical protein
VGFAIRPLGYRLGDIAWWTMEVGTAGIVASTLFLGFAGSRVFLYPLPFNSAGQWGDLATALFSVSVLLAGVSILAWCAAILTVVTGPSSPAGNRASSTASAWAPGSASSGRSAFRPRRRCRARSCR